MIRDLLGLVGQVSLIWSSRLPQPSTHSTVAKAWQAEYSELLPHPIATIDVHTQGRVVIRYANGVIEIRQMPTGEKVVGDLLSKFGIKLP